MSASKMELHSLFWNTAAIAGPSTLRKTFTFWVNRFYCAGDDSTSETTSWSFTKFLCVLYVHGFALLNIEPMAACAFAMQ
jgi:hypothetical protein